MLSLETLWLFVPTITLLVILPGPDFAIVSKISLLDGRIQGQAAAFGVALGICLHTVLAMLGISAILAQSAILFASLKYIGACYLLYLGIKALWLSFCDHFPDNIRSGEHISNNKSENGLMRAFYTGFLTNALNPKAILYFMVLYPQFLQTSEPVFFQFLEMGLLTAFICVAWYVAVAQLLGRIRRLFSSSAFQRWLMRGTGGIFIIFGLKLATQKLE